MKLNKKSVFSILILAFVFLTGTVTSGYALPGYQDVTGPLIKPEDAHKILLPGGTASTEAPQSPVEVTEQIKSLVRGLQNDPDLIYAFVHDHIAYVPIFGDVKGAAGTLTDMTGNDFDQASLMIAMLREAGFTADYVYGTLRLNPAETASWLGTSNPAILGSLIPSAGIPVQVWTYSATELAYLDIDHVWVKVMIDGTGYVFDPSLKAHVHHPGIDLAAVTGFDRPGFVTDALSGSTTGTGWIKDISRQNIRNNLSSMAMNLVDHIRTQTPDASLNEVIGGRQIIKDPAQHRQTSHPFQKSITAQWSAIPVSFKTTLQVRLPGIDQTLYSSDIYGKRLTLFYNGSNQPELKLDGSLIVTGSAVTPASNQTITVNVNHPYAGSGGAYGDASGTISIRAGGSYILVNGWAEISRNMVEKHKKILTQNRYSGGLASSEPVLGQSLAMLSFQWLAECSRIDDLTEPVTKTEIIHHHWIGVCGQNESPYIDMPINLQSVISLNSDANMKKSVFLNSGGHHSAFEWGVIEQTQPPYSAVSTVKLMDQSNGKSDKLFETDSTNFNTIKTLLKNYSANELSHVQAYISAGYRVILPEDGNLGEGTWQGTGFLTVNPSASSVGHIISGGLKGGFGTDPWQTDALNLQNSGTNGQTSDTHAKSNEPIDMVTGHYLYDHTDLKTGNTAFDPVFSRHYNSGDHLSKGSPGLGWSHSFDIKAKLDSDGFLGMGKNSAVDAAGVIAEILATTKILSDSVSRDDLAIATIAHRWTMDLLLHNMIQITRPGLSRQFVKLPDNTFNSPPDSADELILNPDNSIRVTDKHGTVSLFNADGTIDLIRDANQNTLDFTYTDNKLHQVSSTTGKSLTFSYTGSLLTRVEDQALRFVTYAYDGACNLTGFTDASGETTTQEYAADGMLSKIFYPTAPLEPFVYNQYDPCGKIMVQTDAETNRYEYGFSGFRAEEINPQGQSMVWTFDENGRTLSTTDALGNTTQTVYDGLGRVKQVILPLLNETRLAYDSKHNILSETRVPIPGSPESPIQVFFTYHPALNRVSSSTDALGRVTDYTYDVNGNLTRVQLPIVNSIRPEINYTHNTRGQVLTVRDPEGKITRNRYDALTSELLEVIEDDGGKNISTAFTYDTAGNTKTVTSPNSHTTTFYYNPLGKVTASTGPAPFFYETRLIYDPAGNLIETGQRDSTRSNQWQSHATTYTPNFKKESQSDPEGDTALFIYDPSGRVSKTIDPENNATDYIYDAAGRLTGKKDGLGNSLESYAYTPNNQVSDITDGNDNTTAIIYDGLGRVKEREYPDGTKEIYQYNAAGNLLQKTTRNNEAITYAYDALNRLITKTTPEKTITHTYDKAGKPLTVSDGSLTLTYGYDTASRLTSVTRSDGKTIERTYDNAGNLTRLTYPDGYFLTYTYDALNRLTQILESGTTPLATYTYDSLSRRSSVTLGNGVVTEFEYEPDNDMAAIEHGFTGQPVTFNYTANKNGSRTSFSSTDDRFLYQPPADKTLSYTANSLNQYTAINSTNLTHDLNGNLTGTGTSTYTYDPENNLKQVITPTVTATYSTDPLGRRAQKTINTQITEYIYDGDDVIMEFENGTLVRRFIHGPGIDEPVCMITALGRYYYHTDALGSTAALSDASGTLKESYAYSPYGEISSPGTLGNPYLFTGRQLDRESGLYYYRARHYDPGTGRFIQPDPIGFDGGINLYAYVLNNPVNLTDPEGLDTYRQNRVLGFLDKTGRATRAPFTHTFIYTTNPDGSIKHTYSWGNEYDENKKGLWFMDRAEDRHAAEEAINNIKARGNKAGDELLDQYIHEKFNEWKDDLNHPSRHTNWIITNNCKTEADRLINEAKKQRAENGK